ncbi:restriction endonuclease subunit S [Palaeococcus sp. (in: euryarchaeotes)]
MREKPLTEFMGSKKVAKEHKEKPAEPKIGVKGPWELPEGWRWVRLGEIATVIRGASPRPKGDPKYFGGNIPWIKIKDVTRNPGKYLTETEETLTEEGAKKSVYLKKGTLIVTNSATIGIPKVLGIDGCIHDGFLAIIDLKSTVDQDWLYWYFWAIKPYLENLANLGVQKNLNTIIAKKLPVPLPPLSEQKRIVAKLDEVSKRLEEAKRLARGAREEAEKLMASALHEVFSKAEEKGWEWKKIEKVAGIRGNSGVKKKLSQFDSIAFIPMGLIPENDIFARYEIREPANIKSYSYSEPGDILLAKITPSFENGKQGIVPENVPNGFALATTEVYPLYIKDTNSLDRMYLFYILRSKYAREILEDQMLGTTGRQRVPKEAVLKLKIPLPPLEEQQRIVAYLDSISERAQKLVKLYEEREKELEQLFPAILDRAFRGEL